MRIEIALLISGLSLAFAIYFGLANTRRNNRIDVTNEATQHATVMVTLGNINNGVSEIKSEISNIKSDFKKDHERLIKVEESTKSAHKRIDIYERNKHINKTKRGNFHVK